MASENNKGELINDVISTLNYLKQLGVEYILDGPGVRALFGGGGGVADEIRVAPERVDEISKIARIATPQKKEQQPPVAEPVFKTLEEVIKKLGDCKRCKLSDSRKNIVFGDGNPNATLMFVGEGPGRDEDEQGIPFVGRAGQLLDKIIEAIDLKRSDVYIANIVKCRPPKNRNPEPDEASACIPFLMDQIGAIKPKIIVTLGAVATQHLLGTKGSLGSVRGRFHSFGQMETLVMPTFHPAYLLRDPSKKREAWDDMKKVRDKYIEFKE
jgi:uracil-DNA glycosylase